MIATIAGVYLVITLITMRYAYPVGEKLLKVGAAVGVLLMMGTFGKEISGMITIIVLTYIVKRFVTG